MFIKYFTGQIPPKKSRGKGSHGKKTADTSEADVDVSEKSNSKPAKKQTSSRRVIKKKVTFFTDDNIIPEPGVALELGKSVSLTEAVEEEATRDTSSVSKKMSSDPSHKLKGVQTLTPEEQIVVDTMKDLKERVPDESTGISATSSKGTSTKPGVPDEEKFNSEANDILDWGSEQESEYSEEGDDDENIKWVDTDEEEEKDDDDDDKSIDLEKTNDEETDDEFMHREENVLDDDEETDDELIHADEQVNDDEDEEMTNVEYVDTRNGDEEITDTTKVEAEKTEVEKDDIKKAELPPTSSSLSVSSGFGNQFLNLSSDTSLIGTIKDTTDAEINSLLDVQIQQEIPHIQSPSILTVPISVISEHSVLTHIPETPSVAPATTLLPPPTVSSISHVIQQTTTSIPTPPITTEAPSITTILDLLHVVIQRVSVLKKDVQELKEADNTTTLHA
ncbi:hypothetical protein Tco_1420473 [Tanacetum coccineum]